MIHGARDSLGRPKAAAKQGWPFRGRGYQLLSERNVYRYYDVAVREAGMALGSSDRLEVWARNLGILWVYKDSRLGTMLSAHGLDSRSSQTVLKMLIYWKDPQHNYH